MKSHQKQIHDRAMIIAGKYQAVEAEMIGILQEADRVRLHRSFGLSSLLKYAIEYLKLSEPVALAFIAVARKSVAVPALKRAIEERKISVSTANRLVSTVTNENSSELIAFASTHSWRETEREVANRNPKAASPDKVKMLGGGLVQVTVTMSEKEYEAFQRAGSILAQKKSKAPSRSEVVVASVETFLEKHDPIRKAERAQKKSVRTEQISIVKQGRVPLTAAENHAVNLRDQGRCTFVNEKGHRCNQDRWVQKHHIVSVVDGGTNAVSNLTTLCGFHHDLVHQLGLPLEGQVNWLRSPRRIYCSDRRVQ